MSLDVQRLREFADELDQDPATSFTGDDAYEALADLAVATSRMAEEASRLAETVARKLAAVDHIRGGRPVSRRSLRT